MQLIWCLLSNFYLNMFRASLCPSSGERVCTAAYGVLHWLWWLWLCGAGTWAVCTVKVTVTFTVHTARVPAPRNHSQHNQVCTQSITKSPPLYTDTTCTHPTHHLHTPWQRLITPTPHTSHQARATHTSQHPRPIHQTWQTHELDTN